MALVDEFSYKLGDSGVILNPDSLVPPFVDITTVRGLDSAPFRTTERDHEGADGGFMDAEFEKGRPVFLEGTVYADGFDVETFLDSLKANYAPSRVLVPFYFKKPGVSERLLWVKPLGCRYNVDQLRRLGSTEIQFSMFAEDPRIYTAALNDITITQAAVTVTGRGYDKSYSYGYGDEVTPDQVKLIVGGNRPTPAVFTITGPASSPQIINDTRGVTLQFDLSVPTGSQLVVDLQYHTVRLDGQNRRTSLREPNWFLLDQGENFLRYRSATDGSSTMNIKYRDAWR